MRAANCALLVRGMAMPAAGRSAQLALRATVDLAGLLPASVRRAGRLRPGRRVRRHPPTRGITLTGAGEDGLLRYEGDLPLERAGSFGFTVRVLPHHDMPPGTPT